MKIKIITSTNSYDLQREDMEIDGKYRLHVAPLCECPEDAIIGRDLVSCCDVSEFMKEAYEAGKRGEEFEIEIVEEE